MNYAIFRVTHVKGESHKPPTKTEERVTKWRKSYGQTLRIGQRMNRMDRQHSFILKSDA